MSDKIAWSDSAAYAVMIDNGVDQKTAFDFVTNRGNQCTSGYLLADVVESEIEKVTGTTTIDRALA